MDQMAKKPEHFVNIPWQFLHLEKMFFLTFPLHVEILINGNSTRIGVLNEGFQMVAVNWTKSFPFFTVRHVTPFPTSTFFEVPDFWDNWIVNLNV